MSSAGRRYPIPRTEVGLEWDQCETTWYIVHRMQKLRFIIMTPKIRLLQA